MQMSRLVEKAPLRYFGGKWQLAPWIVSHMQTHEVYVEPFFGGGSVLLRKPIAVVEVVAELNPHTYNFWVSLQKDPEQLICEISQHKPSRVLIDLPLGDGTSIQDAAHFWWHGQMAFQGVGLRWMSGTSDERIERVQRSVEMHGIAQPLMQAYQRIANVTFMNCDGLSLVQAYEDSPNALIYCDPTYVHSVRGSKHKRRKGRLRPCRQYLFEMSDGQHIQLCKALLEGKCSWLLSGYQNPIYAEYFSHSTYRDCYNSDRNKGTEHLWMCDRLWHHRPPEQLSLSIEVS